MARPTMVATTTREKITPAAMMLPCDSPSFSDRMAKSLLDDVVVVVLAGFSARSVDIGAACAVHAQVRRETMIIMASCTAAEHAEGSPSNCSTASKTAWRRIRIEEIGHNYPLVALFDRRHHHRKACGVDTTVENAWHVNWNADAIQRVDQRGQPPQCRDEDGEWSLMQGIQ